MSTRAFSLSILICVSALFASESFAQSVNRATANASPQSQEQTTTPTPNGNSLEAVANEMDRLRKSLQTLNTRLREIGEKLSASGSSSSSSASGAQNRVAASLELLGKAEDRVGILRKQLLELIEKDTSYRSRLAQIDEDMRPENVERSLSGVGTTRTTELRDVRRRSLEIEKRGLESLVSVIGQSRPRLEEDLRQAESLVSKIRQRLLPLIDKEIEKINPN